MEYLSDEELVYLYLKNTQSVYLGQLFIRHRSNIYSKCLSFSKDPIEAQDMTQDIFIKLMNKLGSYRGESKFSTWIYVLTLNFCRNYVQAKKKSQKLFLDCNWDQIDVASDDTSADIAELVARQLEWSQKQLSKQEQTMLKLKYEDQISVSAIAQAHNLTVSAVKMKLMRARRKIRHTYYGQASWIVESPLTVPAN
ncbi:RNA polymerase sigma factor [Spirosoma endophyticum]|uniref:RNA polymerase sigma-70 factor, ECF subfamily n=1 Tax=Spirosoma endophyticum TaxID=662367 RepID=A0A1I1VL93_9BACT|nr:sigma-70 family RNA polymerase sigma factor [Spirosoma endophyticum]SFD83639.1 RNA polymerase sigma-70 factor, ECF subfamily [Spirosoma endophyticum]